MRCYDTAQSWEAFCGVISFQLTLYVQMVQVPELAQSPKVLALFHKRARLPQGVCQ